VARSERNAKKYSLQAPQPLLNTTPRHISSLPATSLDTSSHHVTSRQASITVGPTSTGEYRLRLTPTMGGTCSGSVVFLTKDGRFQWSVPRQHCTAPYSANARFFYARYAVETQATAPKPEATLEVSTLVRKAASVEIGIANPLTEPLEFEVQYSHYYCCVFRLDELCEHYSSSVMRLISCMRH
jgi:hypothetical protein